MWVEEKVENAVGIFLCFFAFLLWIPFLSRAIFRACIGYVGIRYGTRLKRAELGSVFILELYIL